MTSENNMIKLFVSPCAGDCHTICLAAYPNVGVGEEDLQGSD